MKRFFFIVSFLVGTLSVSAIEFDSTFFQRTYWEPLSDSLESLYGKEKVFHSAYKLETLAALSAKLMVVT